METNTIIQIRNQRDKIFDEIEAYRNFMKGQSADLGIGQFGQESEYSINGLIGGVKNVLTDISYLVKAHDLFIKFSTYSERNSIYSNLMNLSASIINRQHQQIATYLDVLKALLRSYNLRLDKDRYFDFNIEIDNLRKMSMFLENDLGQIKSKIAESEELHNQILKNKSEFDISIQEVNHQKDELLTVIEAFTAKHNSFEILADKATANESLIASKLEEVIENEETFNDFVKQIDEREKQLTQQSVKTENYETALSEYSKEYERILKESQLLIDKSLQALQYSTSEGISTAFLEQYKIANTKINRVLWLVGAGVFIILTLLLGIWILTGWGIDKNMNPVISIIGRLSLIPFTLLASLFCANQYIKQKNLIEDYAYKSVLAKSMVAFSEELRVKDSARYAEYLSTVLREIHQDPLRKRGRDKDEISLKETTSIIDKISDLIRIVVKQ